MSGEITVTETKKKIDDYKGFMTAKMCKKLTGETNLTMNKRGS